MRCISNQQTYFWKSSYFCYDKIFVFLFLTFEILFFSSFREGSLGIYSNFHNKSKKQSVFLVKNRVQKSSSLSSKVNNTWKCFLFYSESAKVQKQLKHMNMGVGVCVTNVFGNYSSDVMRTEWTVVSFGANPRFWFL